MNCIDYNAIIDDLRMMRETGAEPEQIVVAEFIKQSNCNCEGFEDQIRQLH